MKKNVFGEGESELLYLMKRVCLGGYTHIHTVKSGTGCKSDVLFLWKWSPEYMGEWSWSDSGTGNSQRKIYPTIFRNLKI